MSTAEISQAKISSISPKASRLTARRGEQQVLTLPLNCGAPLASAPLGHFGEDRVISPASTLFLATDAASWITGPAIVADGDTIAYLDHIYR